MILVAEASEVVQDGLTLTLLDLEEVDLGAINSMTDDEVAFQHCL